jgi:hypothetical protein
MNALTTRKQMFEESMKMKVHYLELSGVTFVNFPADVSLVDGELGYDGGMLQIAHQIAGQIPESIRSSVTIDFDRVPAWEMREQNLTKSFGGHLPEEHVLGEASSKLLELISAGE